MGSLGADTGPCGMFQLLIYHHKSHYFCYSMVVFITFQMYPYKISKSKLYDKEEYILDENVPSADYMDMA